MTKLRPMAPKPGTGTSMSAKGIVLTILAAYCWEKDLVVGIV
jgi:hypothetical protein